MNDPLVAAMLSDINHRNLYLTNAWFRTAVDQVALFVVPALVRGLAEESGERQAEMDLAMVAITRGDQRERR